MKIIVGLGNPGGKYEKHRHNIGFWVIDALAEHYGDGTFKDKFQAQSARVSIGGQSALLLKPQTFMNNSGQSVRAALDFYKADPDDVWVLHDELDLSPLKLRVKKGGGEGGHNGLKSITQHLGMPNYHRVRIGIGHPGSKAQVNGYVLNDFNKIESPHFEDLSNFLAPRFGEILSGKGNDVIAQWAQSPTFTLRVVPPKAET